MDWKVTCKQKFISIGVNTSCDTDRLSGYLGSLSVECKFSHCQSIEVILSKRIICCLEITELKVSQRSYCTWAGNFWLNRNNNVLVTVIVLVPIWGEDKITCLLQHEPCIFFIIELISKAFCYELSSFWFYNYVILYFSSAYFCCYNPLSFWSIS